VRATFTTPGTDLRAELVLTQELYLTVLGNPQGQTVEQVCRDACPGGCSGRLNRFL
jgi:hypothetical protein